MSDLQEARKLLAHGGIAAAPEYLRALLGVALAIHDHITTADDTPSAAPAKPADSKPRKGKAD